MDEAWELEEAYWQAGLDGSVPAFYARVLAADAFIVAPGQVVHREDLIRLWGGVVAWTEYSTDERHAVLVNGETVLLSYRVSAVGTDGTVFRSRVSSLYTWVGGWALAFRQYSTEPESTMEFSDEAVARRRIGARHDADPDDGLDAGPDAGPDAAADTGSHA